MATKKSTRSGASVKKSQVREKSKKDKYVHDTVTAIILLGISICMCVCFFAPDTAPMCKFVYDFIFGLLGIGSYALVICLIYISVMLILRHKKIGVKFTFSLAFTLIFSAFVNVITFDIVKYKGSSFSTYIKQLYVGGTQMKSGGVLGGAFSVPLTLLAGKIITGVVLCVLFLVGIAIVFGFTFAKFIKTPEERKAARLQKQEMKSEIMKEENEIRSKANDLSREYSGRKQNPKIDNNKHKPYLVHDTTEEDVVNTINKISDVYLKDRIDDDGDKNKEILQNCEVNNKNHDDTVNNVSDTVLNKEGSYISNQDSGSDINKDIKLKLDNKVTKDDIVQAVTDTVAMIDKSQTDEIADKYIFPPVDLLGKGSVSKKPDIDSELKYTGDRLVDVLKKFNVETHIVDAARGPTVTRYELAPEAGVRISKITNLSDDIALNLAAKGVRIEAPIPGKAAIGIEVPNINQETVNLRSVLDSEEFRKSNSKVSAALGKDIGGDNVVINIEKMPHLLVAGATGVGKSVCINSILISFLYKAKPDEVKLILIDPKMVEFNVYKGIPHLLIPVVTDPKKAAGALSWAVMEMEARYEKLARKNVRDIYGYNRNIAEGEKKLPQIVIVIDELADLMMASPKEVEEAIIRLAQKARAAGMHLIIATQRPSADVVTGLIKANIPSRIALAVSNGVNSRIILDELGAEKLIGKGDMLYDPMGAIKPIRVQGCFVSDREVENIVDFIKQNSVSDMKYDDRIMQSIEKLQHDQQNVSKGKASQSSDVQNDAPQDDDMLEKAIETVVEMGQASTSMLQRRVGLGYARAARLIDVMEQRGYVGPYQGSKPREVLISKAQWQEIKMQSSPELNAEVPEKIEVSDDIIVQEDKKPE